MKKARQIEYQKLQRKDRKEKKDIEKFANTIKNLEDQLSELKRRDKSNQSSGTMMEFETMIPADIIFGRDSIETTKIGNRSEQSDDPSTNIVSVENGESVNISNDESLPTCDETSIPNSSKNATESAVQKADELEKVKGEPTNVTICPSETDIAKIKTNKTSATMFNEGMSKHRNFLSMQTPCLPCDF